MEEEFQLITTLFNWTMGHSCKLQTPLTVLISCTILHCQSTSQPTTVQDTVIPSHLTLSTIKVELNTNSYIVILTHHLLKSLHRFPGIQYTTGHGI